MATVTFGSEDAIYGSGFYAEAVYGEFGPTLIPDSVSASIFTGSLILFGDSNTEAKENSLNSFLGGVQKSGGAEAQLNSEELSSNIGTVIIRATVGLTGQQANSSVGFVKANVVEFVPGITINSFSSGVEIEAGAFEGLTSVSGFSGVGQTSESGQQFDFNGVKELYDRRRTVVLPRVA